MWRKCVVVLLVVLSGGVMPAQAQNQTPEEIALERIEAAASGATELYLSNLGLIALPPEIGQLSNLQELYLFGNELIALPPYSPELNPCERVFEWLRAKIEGEVYATPQHKRCKIEHHLRRLNADKGHLKSLIGWQWIQDAIALTSDP